MPRIRGLTAVAKALLLVWLSACGPAPQPQPPSPPAAPPPPSPLSPEAYQAELTTASDPIAAAFGQIAAAPSVSTLTAAVNAAETPLRDAAVRLDGLLPPEEVSTVNADLVAGLSQMASEVSTLAREVEALAQCAAPAVIASISTGAGANQLRTAASALASGTAGPSYQWGQFLPQPTPPQDRRLPNGQLTHDQRASGSNELRVDNGTDQDAVVTLSQAGAPMVSVYVASGQQTTVRRIADGTYDLFYTTGVDWDEQLTTFTRTCGFARFDMTSTFTTTRVSGGIQYSILQIGLQPTVIGNATTSDVSPEDFPTA